MPAFEKIGWDIISLVSKFELAEEITTDKVLGRYLCFPVYKPCFGWQTLLLLKYIYPCSISMLH